MWQGVLIGCVALIAFNHAITRLGAERSSAMIALVPVLSAVLAFIFLGEVPSTGEIGAILAISAGVSISASLSWQSGFDERADEASGLGAVAARIARF